MSEGQTISSKTPSKYINHGWKAEIGGGERVHDTCKSGEYNWCDRVKNQQVSYEALAGHVILVANCVISIDIAGISTPFTKEAKEKLRP